MNLPITLPHRSRSAPSSPPSSTNIHLFDFRMTYSWVTHAHLVLFASIFIPKPKEWHCTIRGPAGTEFEGGLYHFRILLPSEYPFRPPSILMLTPNGRFELNTKACSPSNHRSLFAHTHPRFVSASPAVRSISDEKGASSPSALTFNRSRRIVATCLGC